MSDSMSVLASSHTTDTRTMQHHRVRIPLGLWVSSYLLACWSVVRSDTPTRDAGGHGVCHVLYRDAVSP